jgi:hypothetical protein
VQAAPGNKTTVKPVEKKKAGPAGKAKGTVAKKLGATGKVAKKS